MSYIILRCHLSPFFSSKTKEKVESHFYFSNPQPPEWIVFLHRDRVNFSLAGIHTREDVKGMLNVTRITRGKKEEEKREGHTGGGGPMTYGKTRKIEDVDLSF